MSTSTHKELANTLARKREWSLRTFGGVTERGPLGPLRHLLKELDEVEATPDEVFEYVDCLFLIDDAAMRSGFDTWKRFAPPGFQLYDFIAPIESPLSQVINTARKQIEYLETYSQDHDAHLGLMILFIQMVNLHDVGWSEFCDAAEAKLQILETRVYPKTPGGVPSEHIR